MIHMERLRRYAEELRRLFDGADADDICRYYDIACIDFDFGTEDGCIKGFIQRNNRCYAIVVNSNLSGPLREIVILHEIMHYRLGHLSSTVCTFQDCYFSYSNSRDSRMRMENEANFLLSDYLLDDKTTIETLREYPLENAASLLCVPGEILSFKCRILSYYKLLPINPGVSFDVDSDFLGEIDCRQFQIP